MRGLIKKRLDVRVVIGVALVITLIAALSMFQYIGATSTFSPYQYELASVNNVDGKGINREASVSGVSVDGNKLLFTTGASNLPQATLVPTERGGYMRDMKNATTIRVDVSTSGLVPDKETTNHIMSATGRYVVFRSSASNIIDGTSLDNSVSRVYLKDLQTGLVELIVNIPYSVVVGYGTSSSPASVSDDGRFVLVTTNRINSLLPGTRSGSGGGYIDLALYDRLKSTWSLVNQPIDNVMQNMSIEVNPQRSTSCDGSLVVFESGATNLTASHSGSGKHVYVADIRNGSHVIDVTQGAVGDNRVIPSISCNGRYITYTTKDRSIISPTPSGLNAHPRLVRYDRFTGERKYIESASDNVTFDSYYDSNQEGYLLSSISDDGDVVLAFGGASSIYSRAVYLKHLSDDSGTLEPVQHNPAGLSYQPNSSPTFQLSPNGKYVVVSSKSGNYLGLSVQDDGIRNILRIKTGL